MVKYISFGSFLYIESMNKYTIYCTEEQVDKAYELGAPITELPFSLEIQQDTLDKYHMTRVNGAYYEIPTAEQIIGWLEEQDDIEEITIQRNRAFRSWAYLVTNKRNKLVSSKNIYQSRKEATIASIDAALEYLTNNKK